MLNYLIATTTSPMDNIQTALQTAFSSISSDFATTIGNVLPVALGITQPEMVNITLQDV